MQDALNLSSVTTFEKHANHINLEDKNESMETVNQTAFELFSDQNIGKRILLNIKERENSCVEQKGGHFEHILKLKDYSLSSFQIWESGNRCCRKLYLFRNSNEL